MDSPLVPSGARTLSMLQHWILSHKKGQGKKVAGWTPGCMWGSALTLAGFLAPSVLGICTQVPNEYHQVSRALSLCPHVDPTGMHSCASIYQCRPYCSVPCGLPSLMALGNVKLNPPPCTKPGCGENRMHWDSIVKNGSISCSKIKCPASISKMSQA